MYRLKHMVPSEILLTIYNGLIKPHIPYGLNCWGLHQEKKKNTKESHANYMFEWLTLSQRASL